MGEVPKEILDKVTEELKTTFRMIGDIGNIETMPKPAFNQFRNQYRSSEVLDLLDEKFAGRVLAITKEDMYTEGLNYIFGQAKMKGRVAIVSIARLDPTFWHQPRDEGLLEMRTVKESIHEIGHVLGLVHCNNRGCVMNFSNTVGDVDKKTKYLCKTCKTQLSL